jgi:hypothetical protein
VSSIGEGQHMGEPSTARRAPHARERAAMPCQPPGACSPGPRRRRRASPPCVAGSTSGNAQLVRDGTVYPLSYPQTSRLVAGANGFDMGGARANRTRRLVGANNPLGRDLREKRAPHGPPQSEFRAAHEKGADLKERT